jgi:hypothetical protein
MSLADALLVDHGTKTVFAIQVSGQLPQQRKLKLSTVQRVAEGLRVDACGYSLSYIYVFPARKGKVAGLENFTDEPGLGLRDVAVQAYLVRACIDPGEDGQELD